MSEVCTFTIRRWQPDDSAALADIFARAVRETASRDYRPAQIEAWVAGPADWAARLGASVTFVAVERGIADEAGRPIGFMQYEPPTRIDMAYVSPARQRRGVASALLAALEAEAKARQIKVLNVEASITSRPFFAGHGFSLLTPQIVRVRGQEFLNYRMQKKLA